MWHEMTNHGKDADFILRWWVLDSISLALRYLLLLFYQPITFSLSRNNPTLPYLY